MSTDSYSDLSQLADGSMAAIFAGFTLLEPVKRIGGLLGPLWNLCDGLLGFVSGGSQLYYTARYAKANHVRKGTLASTDILVSAALIAGTAVSLSIAGPFGFAAAMWYATARSAEAAYRAKQKMDLGYLFDNRLEKLRFVHDKLTQLDLNQEERNRLESIKKRLEIQILAIAIETSRVLARLDDRLKDQQINEDQKQQLQQKFEGYRDHFTTAIEALGNQSQGPIEDIDHDVDDQISLNANPVDNPYRSLEHAYRHYTDSPPFITENEDFSESPETTIPDHLKMPPERSKAITQYLYNKQQEKYIAKTRTTLIWKCASIGMTLMAVSVVCPHAAPVLASVGLGLCLAASAFKLYDLYQDFSDWLARCKLEREVLSKIRQEANTSSASTDTSTISSAATSSSSLSESTEQNDDSQEASTSTTSLSESATEDPASAVGDLESKPKPDEDETVISTHDFDVTNTIEDTQAPNPSYTPAPSLFARGYAFFSRTTLPGDFEAHVRQEAMRRCQSGEKPAIDRELPADALGDKDFIQIKTLAGRIAAS